MRKVQLEMLVVQDKDEAVYGEADVGGHGCTEKVCKLQLKNTRNRTRTGLLSCMI